MARRERRCSDLGVSSRSRRIGYLRAGGLASLLLALCAVLASGSVTAQEPPSIPQWFLDHIDFMTRDGGLWIADNAEYQSEQETTEAYGLVWEKGIGGVGLKGRMFTIEEGQPSRDLWEFRTVWHPAENRVMVHQFGSNGIYGTGWMVSIGDRQHRMQQEFFMPGGGRFITGHEDEELPEAGIGDGHRTSSFDVLPDGSWRANRSYVWRRTERELVAVLGDQSVELAQRFVVATELVVEVA